MKFVQSRRRPLTKDLGSFSVIVKHQSEVSFAALVLTLDSNANNTTPAVPRLGEPGEKGPVFEVVRAVSPGDEVVAQLTPSPDMLLPAITLIR